MVRVVSTPAEWGDGSWSGRSGHEEHERTRREVNKPPKVRKIKPEPKQEEPVEIPEPVVVEMGTKPKGRIKL